MRRKPEILAPAGDMEKLQMAVLYGADAVYLAGTSFGMRSFAGNFTPTPRIFPGKNWRKQWLSAMAGACAST